MVKDHTRVPVPSSISPEVLPLQSECRYTYIYLTLYLELVNTSRGLLPVASRQHLARVLDSGHACGATVRWIWRKVLSNWSLQP